MTAVAVAAVALGACGVPLEGNARSTPADDVPFGLLDAASTTTSATVPNDPQQPQTELAVLYLVQEGRLAQVEREIPAPADVSDRVKALGEQTLPEEADQGYRSVLAAESFVNEARLSSADTALIDLAARFQELPDREQTLALGQLVLTVTSVPDVERVVFTLDGEPLPVPAADGRLIEEPVSRADYLSLVDAA